MFHHFQGAPHRSSYDDLKAVVKRTREGYNRQQQEAYGTIPAEQSMWPWTV